MKNLTANQIIEEFQKLPKASYDSSDYYKIVIFEKGYHKNGLANMHEFLFKKEYYGSSEGWQWVLQ